jgi:hypothetical protein
MLLADSGTFIQALFEVPVVDNDRWAGRMFRFLVEIERDSVLRDAVECFIITAAEQVREKRRSKFRLRVVK